MQDRRCLLDAAVRPAEAKVGDYVLVTRPESWRFVDLLQVVAVLPNGRLRVEGRVEPLESGQCNLPTHLWKSRYVETIRLLSYPLVGASPPRTHVPQFPSSHEPSASVVGRPKLLLQVESVSRSPSNYIDIRLTIRNEGEERVAMRQYQWEQGEQASRELTPFAYQHSQRFNVYTIECGEFSRGSDETDVSYPGLPVDYRIVVCKRAAFAGATKVLIPSCVFGGAIGTFTMLVVDAPPAA